MSIKYHPQADVLLNYAAGRLSPAYREVVAVHAQFCKGCEATINEFEQIGGNMLSELEDTECRLSFDELMQSLEATKNSEQITPTVKPVASLFNCIADEKAWQKITAKIHDMRINIDDEQYRSRLIRIKAGTKIPSHTHKGEEITVVLKGSFKDDSGHYHAGDFIVRDSRYHHAPQAVTECVCFTITDASLDYQGLFGPVLNWFNQRFEKKHYGSVQ